MAKTEKTPKRADSDSGLGLVGGAAAGAAAGSLLGPMGAAVGAIVGGIAGMNKKKIVDAMPESVTEAMPTKKAISKKVSSAQTAISNKAGSLKKTIATAMTGKPKTKKAAPKEAKPAVKKSAAKPAVKKSSAKPSAKVAPAKMPAPKKR